jgi:hypothetical protein
MFHSKKILAGLAFFAFKAALSLPLVSGADNISVLGTAPRWKILEQYQGTITRQEFKRLLEQVYCTHGLTPDMISVGDTSARILMHRHPDAYFTLLFARDDDSREHVPRLWRPARELGSPPPEKPLSGLRIALDPGHLGGPWAKMEERWFQVGNSSPVTEGDMTLQVSRIVAQSLRQFGARVSFVRNNTEPVTPLRPDDFKELARTILIRNGVPAPRSDVLDPADPQKEHTIKWQSEILFYRYSEIRKRAVLVNTRLHPDLVLCLHFNAEGWGDPTNPILIDHNHLHLLVNGSYLEQELELDDERFEMIRRLLSRAFDEELPLAESVAATMSRETGLPAYQYPTDTYVTKVGTSGYVYARNLLATRLYRCPVIYCEPYVMNSRDGFERMQAGDYEGTRPFNGIERKSIFREYAEGVVDGLVDYYSHARK